MASRASRSTRSTNRVICYTRPMHEDPTHFFGPAASMLFWSALAVLAAMLSRQQLPSGQAPSPCCEAWFQSAHICVLKWFTLQFPSTYRAATAICLPSTHRGQRVHQRWETPASVHGMLQTASFYIIYLPLHCVAESSVSRVSSRSQCLNIPRSREHSEKLIFTRDCHVTRSPQIPNPSC